MSFIAAIDSVAVGRTYASLSDVYGDAAISIGAWLDEIAASNQA